MLVNPSIDDLLLQVNNKFKLVTLAMKRARQINEGDPDMKSYNSAKPISKALQEIYDKDIFVKVPTEEADNSSESPAAELALNLGGSDFQLTDSELSLTFGDAGKDNQEADLLDGGLKADI